MADINFYSAINLNGLELKNFRAHNVAQAQATAALGSVICDGSVLKYYASGWHTLASLTDINLDNLGIGSVSGGVGFLKRSSGGAWSFDNSSYLTQNQTITLSGDVTGSGRTAITATIANGAVTNAKLANSKITIGSTEISLGGTAASLTGLTGVTATTFTGALSGNASTATTLATTRKLWGNNFNGSADVSGALTFTATSTASTTADLEVITVNGTRYLHTRLPFYSDQAVSAGGIGTGGGGGGGGDVSAVKMGSTTYAPTAGSTVIEIPFGTIQSGDGHPVSAGSVYTYVQSAIGGLSTSSLTLQVNGTTKVTYTPTGEAKTFNITASDLGIESAMHFKGVVTSLPSVSSYSEGDVVLNSSNNKEYLCATVSGTKQWVELGDEGSYALKTVSISGGKASGHTYGLTGGGTLASDRTITLDATTNTAITNGATAYSWGNHASAGYFLASNFTAANIKSTLGNTAVNRATADASGNTITSTYATKSEVTGLKGTYTSSKRYTISSGSTSFTPSSYEFADNNIVAAIYDGSNNVVVSDMQVVTSSSKYTMKVTFAAATTAALYLVIVGKLA